jgi:hypothetical protein
VAGFFLFFLTGFVFGYAAPRPWSFLPLLLPLGVGLYTGLADTFDGGLFVLILLGLGVTLVGIVLGTMLAASTEGRRSTA